MRPAPFKQASFTVSQAGKQKEISMSSVVEESGGFYSFPIFRAHGILAAFSTRRWNFREKASAGNFKSAWKIFSDQFGLTAESPVYFKQVHGAGIVLPEAGNDVLREAAFYEEKREADAALTDQPGIPVVIFTADCAPVFMADFRQGVAGIAHIGWQGAYQGLAGKMVREMSERFGCQPRDIRVGIGPLIRSCCYEVKMDFRERFGSCVEERGGSSYFSLDGWIKKELEREGVLASDVFDCGFCTACRSDLFFSYRREGEGTGRMCSAVVKLIP